MKSNWVLRIILLVCLIFYTSCKSDFVSLYNKMIHEQNVCILEHPDCSNISNRYYRKIYEMGIVNNDRLLEFVMNENLTNWETQFFRRKLTDGDLAIALLIDINKISDNEFYYLMPNELHEEFTNNGVIIWWDWIHNNIDNRKFVFDRLEEIIEKNEK